MTEQKIKKMRSSHGKGSSESTAKRQCSPYETEVKKHTEHIGASCRRGGGFMELEIVCNQASGVQSHHFRQSQQYRHP